MTAAGIQARGDHPLNNITGTIDGVAIRQEKPSYMGGTYPSHYRNRKGFFLLIVKAVCDYNYEFPLMCCRTPDYIQDATELAFSDICERLQNRKHPNILQLISESLCIAADDAYGDGELLQTPWPGGGRWKTWRDAYDLSQSSARMHIEQAFGQLDLLGGALWRPMRMPFAKRPLMGKVAFFLHSVC